MLQCGLIASTGPLCLRLPWDAITALIGFIVRLRLADRITGNLVCAVVGWSVPNGWADMTNVTSASDFIRMYYPRHSGECDYSELCVSLIHTGTGDEAAHAFIDSFHSLATGSPLS